MRRLGLFACLATVILHWLCLPGLWSIPEAAYVCYVPVLLWAYVAEERDYILGASLTGFLSWLIGLFWLRHVTWGGMFFLALYVGAFTAIWLICARRVLLKSQSLLGLIFLGFLWVSLESARGWVWVGFPWLPLAASQWERPAVLQLIAYGGVGALSFTLILWNLGIAAYVNSWLKKPNQRWDFRRGSGIYLGSFLVFASIILFFNEVRRSDEELPMFRAAFVQPYTPATLKWAPGEAQGNLEVLERLTLFANELSAHLIFWPEAATPYPIRGDYFMETWAEDLAQDIGITILSGNLAIEPEGWYNGVFVITPEGVQEDYYAKEKRVPFGEYVPGRHWMPSWVSKVVPLAIDILPAKDFKTLSVSAKGRTYALGGLVCFEDIFTQLAKQHVIQGADFLYIVTNNAWYLEEGGAYQHAAHSVLRAVEMRRPVLRCGNAGWSGWIDELGRIRFVMQDETVYLKGVQAADISRSSYWSQCLSPYVVYGHWFLVISLLASFLGIVRFRLWRQ